MIGKIINLMFNKRADMVDYNVDMKLGVVLLDGIMGSVFDVKSIIKIIPNLVLLSA